MRFAPRLQFSGRSTHDPTDFTEMVVRVTKTGGCLVHQNFYSAPLQLIGKRLRVHVHDGRIEAFLGATPVVIHPHHPGRDDGLRVHCVNYRHVIHALRRKPQALAGSVYRDGVAACPAAIPSSTRFFRAKTVAPLGWDDDLFTSLKNPQNDA
jgi:hypothetical protein